MIEKLLTIICENFLITAKLLSLAFICFCIGALKGVLICNILAILVFFIEFLTYRRTKKSIQSSKK